MPQWYDKPEKRLDDALSDTWVELHELISDNPSFDMIVGLNPDRINQHADDAIKSLLEHKQGRNLMMSPGPSMLAQIYIFGFVVGTKFAQHKPPPDKEESGG